MQEEQLGTGHAVAQTAGAIDGVARVVVLYGDVPLVTAATLEAMLEKSADAWGALAVARLDRPGSLGRVVCREGDDSALERIVEAADAGPQELAIRTVNAGIYVLPAPDIFDELEKLGSDNAQGEIYLTDAVTAAVARGETLRLHELVSSEEALGVNSRADLVRVRRVFQRRKNDELLAAGVSLWEPRRILVEPGVEVGRDTEIEPDVTLTGATRCY